MEDSDVGAAIMCIGVFVLLGLILGFVIGGEVSHSQMSKQAFERGYMQQCVGTDKLYWKGECPEVKQ